MRKTTLFMAALVLSTGTAAWAGDSSGKGEGRMQGSPNAAGFKGEGGTSSSGSGGGR
ncbi:hypothetical protein [Methylorubrum sp. POS3]|uniref:hypothetical protein n=1 Tax=Methylorubrum sp. POS3 TaxID=2998492 RepID=UPI003728C8AE